MLVNKTYTIEIFPDDEMTQLFQQHVGAARFCYNYLLNLSQESYKTTGKRLFKGEMLSILASLKRTDEFKWLKEIYSTTVQNAAKCLDDSYKKFFSGQNELPRFKSRKRDRQSFLLVCNHRDETSKQTIRVESIDGKLKLRLNKLGYVDFTQHRKPPIGTIINTASIVFESNRWFAKLSCTTEINRNKASKATSDFKHTAIDPGVKTLMTFSDGQTIAKFDLLNTHEERMLKIWLKRASRRYKHGVKKQSNNYYKARDKANKLIRKAINRRNDVYHKITTDLAKEYSLITVEDTSFKKLMTALHNTAKTWQAYAPATFLSMLEYKCSWYGTTFIKAPKYLKSTQICSECGCITGPKGMQDLSIRHWTCSECGTEHDRDVNATKNLDAYGLNEYKNKLLRGHSGCKDSECILSLASNLSDLEVIKYLLSKKLDNFQSSSN